MAPFFFLSMVDQKNSKLRYSDWLGEEFQPFRKWILELPWSAKQRAPCERALKTKMKTGVKQ